MAPIRVGLVGLSTSSDMTNWCATAHLPYLKSSNKYEIVALCNSSVERAQASIEKYELPNTVKAYGSPKDLAADQDIDLAVCVVAPERHYEVLVPLIEAGKPVYSELPLAANIGHVRELVEAAEKKKVSTILGMQGQANPIANTIKNMIDEGKLGRILTSTVVASAGVFGGQATPTGLRMLHMREAGGNIVTVWFLHTFNLVLHVLGELDCYSSILENTHPQVRLFDKSDPDKKVVETIESDTPDEVMLQGRFLSGALLSYHLKGGKPFPGEPALRWHIVGDKGEVMITNPVGAMDIVFAGAKVMFREHGSDEATEISVPEDEMSKTAHPVQGVARLYEAYADGQKNRYPDWTVGMKRHALMDELFQRWDGSKPYGEKAQYSV